MEYAVETTAAPILALVAEQCLDVTQVLDRHEVTNDRLLARETPRAEGEVGGDDRREELRGEPDGDGERKRQRLEDAVADPQAIDENVSPKVERPEMPGAASSPDVRETFEQGVSWAMAQLMSLDDVCPDLNVKPSVVRRRMVARGVGHLVGASWVFEPGDLARLKPGPHGRPRKSA